MILYHIIKYALLFIIFLNSLIINNERQIVINNNLINFGQYSLSSYENKITNIPEIFFAVENIYYSYSTKFNMIEIIYYIVIFDQKFCLIKPSDLIFLYHIGILCNFYSFETKENIYSIANIHENRYFYCVEQKRIKDHTKYGIKAYKINDLAKEIEFNELFFFTDKLINIKGDKENLNNLKFDHNKLYRDYNEFLLKMSEYKKNGIVFEEANNLKLSYLQPPLCFLKRDISLTEGIWYFKNIYNSYFCFCRGESCLNILSLNTYNFQSCKYFFYLTILDNNKYLYPKTDYLLSDFFQDNIESSEAFPIFQEMIKRSLNAHYLTASWDIYNNFCSINENCKKDLQIIYGIRRIDGDTLEKYFELFLRLKAVITAEKYDSIDNLFYNIDYITYIFLGHGVTYIKSFLYNDYLSPKRYNKILLPPTEKIINLALEAGWKNEDIIKIGYPKWDNYKIHIKKTFFPSDSNEIERSIFVMFTWRKLKRRNNLSILYYSNIYNLLNDSNLNEQLYLNNIKFYFCYHHTLKGKKIIEMENNTNIRFIPQKEISTLIKNSSLIITDFSSILFDAIVQRKPLILFIPDGLEPNLEDIYTNEYYETITKIINGEIYLYEVFIDLNKVIKKIIYYIKNDFVVENEKMKFYKQFKFINKGNTKKFINYIKNLEE